MPRYSVVRDYTAVRDGRVFGPWAKGNEVELEAADAEWVNRDSPGALAEPEPEPKAEPEPEPKARTRRKAGER